MRTLLLSAAFCVCFSASAYADGRAFPPDHCSPGAPFMAFSGIDGSNTFCDSGQDILSSALLPGCSANQQVVYDGSKFVCKDEPNVPTCPDNQVLTFLSGTGFTCVNANAQVPTCTATQFLTYNGTSFQCAATQQIPVCADGQILAYQGGKLACADPAASSGPTRIVCEYYNTNIPASNSNYQWGAVWGGNDVLHHFTAAECGGVLPDSSYVAIPASWVGSCMTPDGNFITYQSDNANFPGFGFGFTNCQGALDVRIVYIKTDPASPPTTNSFDFDAYNASELARGAPYYH